MRIIGCHEIGFTFPCGPLAPVFLDTVVLDNVVVAVYPPSGPVGTVLGALVFNIMERSVLALARLGFVPRRLVDGDTDPRVGLGAGTVANRQTVRTVPGIFLAVVSMAVKLGTSSVDNWGRRSMIFSVDMVVTVEGVLSIAAAQSGAVSNRIDFLVVSILVLAGWHSPRNLARFVLRFSGLGGTGQGRNERQKQEVELHCLCLLSRNYATNEFFVAKCAATSKNENWSRAISPEEVVASEKKKVLKTNDLLSTIAFESKETFYYC